MIEELGQDVALVYVLSMPKVIFEGLECRTKFIQYPDWTTRMKKEAAMRKEITE